MDTIAPDSSVTHTPSTENEQSKMFDFSNASIHLKRIISDWIQEKEDTNIRRKERKLDIRVEELRQKQQLDEDETIIPIRIIDMNIRREQPPYINYIKNSRRISIFECLSDPDQDTDNIEQEFTKKASFTNWETPHFKCLDGSQTHGWDAVEVTFDESKPGNFSIEHIGHDKLFFPRSAIELQECPRILRVYEVTFLQLRKWVASYNFSAEQVEQILESRKETNKENETIIIYKLYFKDAGQVFVAWFSTENGCTDWLKAPTPFYCGIDEQIDVPTNPLNPLETTKQWNPKKMDMYPIFILPYSETEEQQIVNHKGRAFLDSFKQEAQTALWSSYINGMNRACNVYASPAQEDGSGTSLKEVSDIKLVPGRILNRPMQFWSPPYPDPSVLRTLQYADSANSEETNQVNFAAMNREDSRKTAKEIGAAQQQQNLLNSVQLTLFSTFIRQVYSFAWLICQSQALQNNITFLQVKKPQINPATGQPLVDPQTGQPITSLQNNVEVIGKIYSIRAAGDVDVIQRDELIQRMQQDFQLVMQTPLKDQFMIDYIRLKYPDKADLYVNILGQSGMMNNLKSLVAQFSEVLQGVLKDAPNVMQTLQPQEQSQIADMIQQAQQVTGQQPQ